VVQNTENTELRSYFRAIQYVLQSRELSVADRRKYEADVDQTIRLIFYGKVSRAFDKFYASDLEQGFQRLGLRVPDFGVMSRSQAMKVFAEAEEAAAAEPMVDSSRLLGLLHGLRDLDSTIIPKKWVIDRNG
jgi:hypothetical protein